MSTKKAARDKNVRLKYNKAQAKELLLNNGMMPQQQVDQMVADPDFTVSDKELAKLKQRTQVSQSRDRSRAELVSIYRNNSTRTIRNIRQGLVNEVDIDKLWNFMQTSLALMQMVPVSIFREAQRNAEINAFLHTENEDESVVLDPNKQPPIEADQIPDLDYDAIIEETLQAMQDMDPSK
jgi:hypothetical protein